MMTIPEKIKITRNKIARETSIRTKARGKTVGQRFVGFTFPSVESYQAIDKENADADSVVVRENKKWSLLQPWLQFMGPELVSELLDSYYGAQTVQKYFEKACSGLRYTCNSCKGVNECTCAEGITPAWEMTGTFDAVKFSTMVVEDSARSESDGAKSKRILLRFGEIAGLLSSGKMTEEQAKAELLKLSRGEI
jgi:hypothetical protein